MVINSVLIVVIDILWFFYRWIRRKLDSFGSTEDNTSKCKSIYEYVNKFAGPELFIYSKYSRILNTVFITCIFGISMPLLFMVTAGTFAIMYVKSVIMIFYVYKKPEEYDPSLNDEVYKMLNWAPVLMLISSFW